VTTTKKERSKRRKEIGVGFDWAILFYNAKWPNQTQSHQVNSVFPFCFHSLALPLTCCQATESNAFHHRDAQVAAGENISQKLETFVGENISQKLETFVVSVHPCSVDLCTCDHCRHVTHTCAA
jgi:hypothetical protein